MELSANKREILGKKVRFLRRQGITPVHLFGRNVEPMPLQCDTTQLQHVLVQTGKTGLISLKIDKAKRPRNVMVREVQREPRTDELLHVDFYQVRMEEKIRVGVPIIPVGEAPALRFKENFLAQELNSLTVECLPDEIPSKVELDLSDLTEVDQSIHVKDIILDGNITVLDDPDQLVVKISAGFIEKAIEEEEVEAEVEAEAEALEEAGQPEEEPKGESSDS
jgi:large subunit ribosomal protein L25